MSQARNSNERQFSPDSIAQFFEQQGKLFSQWSAIPMQALQSRVPGLEVPEWLRRVIDPTQLEAIQQEYVNDVAKVVAAGLYGYNGAGSGGDAKGDRRFASPEWHDHGVFEFISRMYLLNARAMTRMADAVRADAKTKAKVRFAVGQWVDAMSPANFLATNPEAQKKIIDTSGESLKAGISNLLADMQKGRISMTDESRFEVGKNVATTEGMVVFENEVFQLIQYKPLAAEVGTRPLLMVPPCINKFYILDLQPTNSLVRYAVEQGNTVFLVSWRNPTEECGTWTWDDYIEKGVVKAIEVAAEIGKTATRADRINLLGFCVGGTLVATALAALAARGKKPVASLTLLTTLLDFTNTGVLDVFIDEAQVRMREETIGKHGLMPARDLATTFSFLRPNDLVWPYVVGNYLKGETPPAFDLLYWNADSTNLPGPMYAWYLRNTYLDNNLVKPNRTAVTDTKVDLRKIDVPVFIYGSREDHIVPWEAAYASTQVLTGVDKANSLFVLGASGHIAGVINPAASGKRNYWIGKAPKKAARGKAAVAAWPADPQAWLADADSVGGSWWPTWAAWLGKLNGPRAKAPSKFGSTKYRPIEPAPGRYVKVRVV